MGSHTHIPCSWKHTELWYALQRIDIGDAFVDRISQGTVMAEQVARDSAEGQYQESITDLGGFMGTHRAHETVQNFGPINNCVNIPSVSLSPPRDIAKALENWLEKTLLSPGNLTQLAALTEEKVGVVTDDDLRVRELTKEERAPVVGWLELSSELMMVNRIREVGTSLITPLTH